MRREAFPKYTETYKILNQFGDSVLTSEGALWRMHRKVTSASFNEKNSALVFRESIRQAQGMVDFWTKGETLTTVEHDTMRLALNIIGYVGFGLRLPWPNQKMTDEFNPKYGSIEAPQGFSYSFIDTMAQLLDNLLMLLLVPNWLLKVLPIKRVQMAVNSRKDYEKYLNELLDQKIEEAAKGERDEEGMDLMGQLVRSSYEVNDNKSGAKSGTLTRNEIMGNAFVMLVAGHETTANAIHFSLLQLATHPASQRRLQKDLDDLVGNSDISTWDYDTLANPMLASMIGAVMNETLRVLPAVTEIPKITTPSRDQTLVIDGEKHLIPAGTVISLCASSAHMNPRHWPERPSRFDPSRGDIGDYVPERWFRGNENLNKGEEEVDQEDYGGFQGRDTSEKLFRPERGAYFPFSDGARSCLGRRIAQVEVISALAVVFRNYSIELAVDEWASEEELERMSRQEKGEIYNKAADKSRQTMREATSILTLKLHGKVVPVRLVPRGEEKFVSWVDEGC